MFPVNCIQFLFKVASIAVLWGWENKFRVVLILGVMLWNVVLIQDRQEISRIQGLRVFAQLPGLDEARELEGRQILDN